MTWHCRARSWPPDNLSVFRLDAADHLLSRVEADHATLRSGNWLLSGARTITPDHLPVRIGDMKLPTDLTARRVQESFQSPETLSVWALPGFIHLLENAGFSSVRHRLHFQSLLALPLLCGTMALWLPPASPCARHGKGAWPAWWGQALQRDSCCSPSAKWQKSLVNPAHCPRSWPPGHRLGRG